MDASQLSIADAALFWSLATYRQPSIAPRSWLNEWFEEGLLRDTPDGEWALNRRHPQCIPYWKASFQLILRAMLSQGTRDNYLFLGMQGDPLVWKGEDIHLFGVRNTGHIDDEPVLKTDIFHSVSLLNDGLSHVPRRWRPPRVLLQLYAPERTEPIDDMDWRACEILGGSNVWFLHRHTYTGLLLEPALGYCYANDWTPAAIDILLTSGDSHRRVFFRLWLQNTFSHDMLEKVRPGLSMFLQTLNALISEEHLRLQALHAWVEELSLLDLSGLEGWEDEVQHYAPIVASSILRPTIRRVHG